MQHFHIYAEETAGRLLSIGIPPRAEPTSLVFFPTRSTIDINVGEI